MSNLIRVLPAVRNGLGDPRSTGAGRPHRSPDVNAVRGTLKGPSTGARVDA